MKFFGVEIDLAHLARCGTYQVNSKADPQQRMLKRWKACFLLEFIEKVPYGYVSPDF